MKNPSSTKKGTGRRHVSGIEKKEVRFDRSHWSFLAYQAGRGKV